MKWFVVAAVAFVLATVAAWAQNFPSTYSPAQGVTTVMAGGTTSGTANTFTTALAANPNRRACIVSNTNASGTIYVWFGSGTATTGGSIALAPGISVSCSLSPLTVATDAIQVAGSSTNMSYGLAWQ